MNHDVTNYWYNPCALPIEKLWGLACSGDIKSLKFYYDHGGKANRRYVKFGKTHSLIAGAFRNGEYATVEYLRSVGETTEGEAERIELKAFYMESLIAAAGDLVDYFRYHNKNTTKAQDAKIEALAEILELLK